ncbi:unnamed protein product [Symbiodinium necroappetens]|uniref:Uncharacterized protein n=1 Tax=Symbiodinium necroappetens TaxID=1628268 RepID=A0A812NVV0_9DINO|nr:unnamed protein product [Symbiodinium necroappetens]
MGTCLGCLGTWLSRVPSQETSNPLPAQGDLPDYPWIQQVASAAGGAFEPVLGRPLGPLTLKLSTPFAGCAPFVDVINEKPSTKAEVEFALLRRKIQQAGHDPPDLFLCTLENLPHVRGVTCKHVYVALFKVFAPARGVPPPQLKDNVHAWPIRHQSGFHNDTVVMDLDGRDGSGVWHSYRLCHEKSCPGVPSPPWGYSEQDPELKYWQGLLEEAERLTSVSLASRCCDTPEEALSYLMVQLADMIFSWDKDFFEMAWLARSFEIGNAGNLPSGSCGTPVFKFGTKQVAGMYSCVTADAPWKCVGHAPEAEPDVLPHVSFVRVQKLTEEVLSESRGPTSSESLGPEWDDWEACFRPSESAEIGVDLNECNLQRLSDCIYRISDLDVDVQQLRFTQNTISCRFRDGRSVKSLAEDLRAGASKAADLPKLQVFEYEDALYSLDNRRLFALKVAGISRIVAEKVQVRRDLLSKKLTTTSSGRIVVFANDPSIPDVADFNILVDNCSGSQPNCSHRVQVTHMGSTRPTEQVMTAHEIVKIQAKNRLPVDERFQPVFMDVMLGLAFPPKPSATQPRRKQTEKAKVDGKKPR